MEGTGVIAVLVFVFVVVVLWWVIFHYKWTRPTSPEYLTLRRRRGKPRIVKIERMLQGGEMVVSWLAKNGTRCYGTRTEGTIERLKIATVC